MARPVPEAWQAEDSATGTSVTLSAPSGTVTADALVVFVVTQEGAGAVTSPGGDWEDGPESIDAGTFDAGISSFVLPAGSTKTGSFVFTFGSCTYQGAAIGRISGSDLEWTAGTTANGDDDSSDVLVAGFAAGNADRLAVAGTTSLNVASLTGDEGIWTHRIAFEDNYAAAYTYDAGTGSQADVDTGLNDTFAWASVSLWFEEGSNDRTGSGTPSEANDTSSGSGTFVPGTLTGSGTPTEADDTSAGTGTFTAPPGAGTAGAWATVSGSGQAIPTTSFASIDMGSIDADADSILSESSGVFTPQAEGYYLIIGEARHQITHNNRHNWELKLRKNSSDVAGGWGSAYARNSTNDLSWARASAILHFNGTSDTFDFQHRRDTGAGTPAGTYDWTRIKVVQLSDGGTGSLPYGHYGTPTSGAFGGTTPTAIAGWDVITETDTSVIELQAGGTDIRLKESGRPYLVTYALKNSDTGGNRTGRIGDITLDGTLIPHGSSQAYQRNSTCQYATPEGMALVRTDAVNEDLNVRCYGHTNPGWGTFDNGSWTLSSASDEAGVFVIALPSAAAIAIFEDTTGGQTFSGSGLDNMNMANVAVGTTDAPFSRSSAEGVSVTSGTDVFMYAGVLAERTASSGARQSNAVRIELEGVDQTTFTEMGDYLRGDQSSQDHYNGFYGACWVGSAATDDTFQLEKFDPGTDDGANDSTVNGGSFYIDLSTLVVASDDVTGSGTPSEADDSSSGTGTHTPPTRTGSGTPSEAADASAGTGTHTPPTFTGSAAETQADQTASGAGTFSVPVYTGSGTPSELDDTSASVGTHTAPVFTGSGTPSQADQASAGTGTFGVPVFTATGSPTEADDGSSGSGTHVAPVFTGAGAVTEEDDTSAGVGTNGTPTFTGSGAVTEADDVSSGAGTFTPAPVSGTGEPSQTGDSSAGVGTHTAPVFTGSGTPNQAAETAAGTGSFTSPVFTGSGAATQEGQNSTGSGTFLTLTVSGSGAVTQTDDTSSGAGTHTAPVVTGSGTPTETDDASSGAGTHTAPTSTGGGAPVQAGDAASGSGTFVPVFTGSGGSGTEDQTASGTGQFLPVFTATGAIVEEDDIANGTATAEQLVVFTGSGVMQMLSDYTADSRTFKRGLTVLGAHTRRAAVDNEPASTTRARRADGRSWLGRRTRF